MTQPSAAPAVVGPRTTVPPDPDDRLSAYSRYWLGWVLLGFGVPEAMALRREHLNAQQGRRDKVKRTLSANGRWAGAYNSVTGVPVGVKYGKLRRFALAAFLMWFARHISREGEM